LARWRHRHPPTDRPPGLGCGAHGPVRASIGPVSARNRGPSSPGQPLWPPLPPYHRKGGRRSQQVRGAGAPRSPGWPGRAGRVHGLFGHRGCLGPGAPSPGRYRGGSGAPGRGPVVPCPPSVPPRFCGRGHRGGGHTRRRPIFRRCVVRRTSAQRVVCPVRGGTGRPNLRGRGRAALSGRMGSGHAKERRLGALDGRRCCHRLDHSARQP
jgi:hypothetical protein